MVLADLGAMPGNLPNIFEDVDTNGWLERFCDMVLANRDWLEPATLAEAVDRSLPLGKAYPSECSYRDMRVRYPESDEMYARMLGISERLAAVQAMAAADPDYLDIVRDGLYRGQAGDAYWPGSSAGLYRPQLRDAVYHHLIAADNAPRAVEERTGHGSGSWATSTWMRLEVRLENDRLIALVRPAHGGHIYELDVPASRYNIISRSSSAAGAVPWGWATPARIWACPIRGWTSRTRAASPWTDPGLELSVALAWSQSAGVWCFPIETVSQSEAGLERIGQSSAIIPHWHVIPDDHGRWDVSIRWSFERAAGLGARQLGIAHLVGASVS